HPGGPRMNGWQTCGLLTTGLLALGLSGPAPADAPAKAGDGVLIVVDGAGKEHKLHKWEFHEGVEPLAWLAPAAPAEKAGPKDKGKPRVAAPRPAGPPALKLREEDSTDRKST